MAKTVAERQAAWRKRVAFKASLFDQHNTERAARIRQALPDDQRPETRALIEYLANYPRCQHPPKTVDLDHGAWVVGFETDDPAQTAAAYLALREVTSLEIIVVAPRPSQETFDQVREEVAEMRALGLWGRS